MPGLLLRVALMCTHPDVLMCSCVRSPPCTRCNTHCPQLKDKTKVESYKPGQQLEVTEIFKEGEAIDIAGTTIGKGFQGGCSCLMLPDCTMQTPTHKMHKHFVHEMCLSPHVAFRSAQHSRGAQTEESTSRPEAQRAWA